MWSRLEPSVVDLVPRFQPAAVRALVRVWHSLGTQSQQDLGLYVGLKGFLSHDDEPVVCFVSPGGAAGDTWTFPAYTQTSSSKPFFPVVHA